MELSLVMDMYSNISRNFVEVSVKILLFVILYLLSSTSGPFMRTGQLTAQLIFIDHASPNSMLDLDLFLQDRTP